MLTWLSCVLISQIGFIVYGAHDTFYYYVSPRFFPSEMQEFDSATPSYYQISICDSASFDGFMATLSIIQPYNTQWDNDLGNTYVEVSGSLSRWENSTVMYTNYKYSRIEPTFYRNISWEWNSEQFGDIVYIRFMGDGRQVDATFEFTWTNETVMPNYGSYDSGAIKSETYSSTADTVLQYGRTASSIYAQNEDYHYVIFDFCAQTTSVLSSVEVIITADSDYRQSAFDLYLCGSNYDIMYCTPSYYDSIAAHTVSVETASIQNSGGDLDNGIYALVISYSGISYGYFDAFAIPTYSS